MYIYNRKPDCFMSCVYEEVAYNSIVRTAINRTWMAKLRGIFTHKIYLESSIESGVGTMTICNEASTLTGMMLVWSTHKSVPVTAPKHSHKQSQLGLSKASVYEGLITMMIISLYEPPNRHNPSTILENVNRDLVSMDTNDGELPRELCNTYSSAQEEKGQNSMMNILIPIKYQKLMTGVNFSRLLDLEPTEWGVLAPRKKPS